MGLGLLVAAAVILGFAVGRWWAIPLAVVPFALWAWHEHHLGRFGGLALLILPPVVLVALIWGIVLRWLVRMTDDHLDAHERW
jgi:hypothetical protein